jgi:predicted transcriptional regulator
MAGLFEERDRIESLVARSGLTEPQGAARHRVEFANYFATALLMPCAPSSPRRGQASTTSTASPRASG